MFIAGWSGLQPNELLAEPADARSLEGDGWVNWSGLATLVTSVPYLVASSLNRLVARPLRQNDADDLTRESPVL